MHMTRMATGVRFMPAVLLATLALAQTSPAGASAPMTRADRRAIGTLVDRFVKDVVLRRNLPDGWAIAGPDLRGGTTRKAWDAGTGVTVAAFPARGTVFENSWTVRHASTGEADLTVILLPRRGMGEQQIAANVDVRRLRGTWIVDSFYTAAVFRTGRGNRGSCGTPNCAVSGPSDFTAGAQGAAASLPPRVGSHTVRIVLAALGAILVTAPVGLWFRLRRRERRARLEYARWNAADP